MATEDVDEAPEARPPLLADLVALCRDLNAAGAAYVVIGGMAVIQAGFPRATGDIDLLIDVSLANQERVRRALMQLQDQAVRDVRPGDLDRYAVVRVGDQACSPGSRDQIPMQAGSQLGAIVKLDEPYPNLLLVGRRKRSSDRPPGQTDDRLAE